MHATNSTRTSPAVEGIEEATSPGARDKMLRRASFDYGRVEVGSFLVLKVSRVGVVVDVAPRTGNMSFSMSVQLEEVSDW